MVFFFERVPAIIPVKPLPYFSPHQTRLTRWGEVFLRQGGGRSVQGVYDEEFYVWWERPLLTLEQFPYRGLEFQRDNDLVFPPRGMWGELGIFLFMFLNFDELCHKIIYICIRVFNPF